MAAIYLHIPFCKQACYYCDFHFSTQLRQKVEMVNAMCQEIALQKNYLNGQIIQSIYFGGGTPSLLNEQELNQLLETLYSYFEISPQAEITLEANPDDIQIEKLKLWKQLNINRLSIGVQSFHDLNLKYLHRVHNADLAKKSILQAQDAGFENLTIDLIYAIPTSSEAIWQADLARALALQVPHISAYCLTIEEKTVFGKWLKQQKIQDINEDHAALQFEILIQTLTQAGFVHYEISNFAKPGKFAQHNSNYWKKGHYLGIGASAHSYNGISRQYNIANNAVYIQKIAQQIIPCQIEYLSPQEQLNEYIMTSLRTIWGCNLDYVQQNFNIDLLQFQAEQIENYLKNGLISIENQTLRLTHKGKFLADKIASDLFWV
ncbi:MAG: radical SAM family heme chaperone HemW [Microscillaceae bacterium]|nr:radical SAM family heme chaperone HemW [Microscillaceae bacterium]MDW8459758.1 radical SAM family heme chaperone HemW [Cytophagales bacterium]